jgi:hypothetical protein
MFAAVHESGGGTKQTSKHVRFSNRPFGVKHFQTIHRTGVDVARGLALMSSGSTRTAKSGWFSTSSLIRASNFTFPAIPTLRPKLRKVARTFPNDLARLIHNADARLLDRNV